MFTLRVLAVVTVAFAALIIGFEFGISEPHRCPDVHKAIDSLNAPVQLDDLKNALHMIVECAGGLQ